MSLLKKLSKLLYPTGYLQQAVGQQASPKEIMQCKDTYKDIPLNEFLIPSIRWDNEKQDYVAVYHMPKNIHRYK